MPPQELVEHRRKIAVIVDIELDGYFRPDMGEGRRSLLLSRWCDELQDWPSDAIRAAMAKWCRENPRIRPNYGDILQILQKAWGEKNAPQVRAAMQQHEAPREPVSAERAAELVAAFGFAPKRVEPLKDHPSPDEIKAMIDPIINEAAE